MEISTVQQETVLETAYQIARRYLSPKAMKIRFSADELATVPYIQDLNDGGSVIVPATDSLEEMLQNILIAGAMFDTESTNADEFPEFALRLIRHLSQTASEPFLKLFAPQKGTINLTVEDGRLYLPYRFFSGVDRIVRLVVSKNQVQVHTPRYILVRDASSKRTSSKELLATYAKTHPLSIGRFVIRAPKNLWTPIDLLSGDYEMYEKVESEQ